MLLNIFRKELLGLDEVINRILEIDHNAAERLELAHKKKQEILNEAKLEEIKIKENCIKRADNRIAKVEEFEKQEADEKINEINLQKQTKISKLDELFNSNQAQWKNEIFHRIVGE